MQPTRRRVALGIVTGILLGASAASAQVGLFPETSFFPDVPVRGPIVLYPTFSLTEEFNDNVFLDNSRKRSDWITGFTPAIRLVLESATYRWAAGYSFTAEKYANNTELDNAFQRQNLFVTGMHRIDPRLTLTLSEVFFVNNNSNLVSQESIAIGRTTSRSNTFNPGLTYQFTPTTGLRSSLTWTIQRYDDPAANGSDVYRLGNDVFHEFSSRLTGSVGYEFAYLDVDRQVGTSTHTPRVGGTYWFTPTISTNLLVGPTIRTSKEETAVSPYVNATVSSLFSWGSAGAYFNRYVGTSGGVGGASENTALGATVQVSSLVRDLVIEFGPRFNISQSSGAGTGNESIRSFTLGIRAAYRITTWLSAMLGYQAFIQRTDTTAATLARDVDQNRVFFGLQAGVPFKFD